MQKKSRILIWILSPILIIASISFGLWVSKPWIFKEGIYYIEYVINGQMPSKGIDARKVKVDGIDISHWNGWIDWNKVSQNKKIKFAYIKASDGNTYVDPLFKRNIRNAKKAGIEVGAYHFFRSSSTGKKQFENFKKSIGKDVGTLIPMIDVEDEGISAMKRTILQQELSVFCELVIKKYGRKPIIYTTRGIFTNMLSPKFDSYYIWISSYSSQPKLKGKSKHNIWQYTKQGKVDGIGGFTDLSCFENGMTLDKLLLFK